MKKINLAISGCMGRMGQQLIKSSKKNKKFKLVSLTENRSVNKKFAGIKPELNSKNAFKKIDVIIDFTVPDCTLEILKIASKLKKRVVIGTTGFENRNDKQNWPAVQKTRRYTTRLDGSSAQDRFHSNFLTSLSTTKTTVYRKQEQHTPHSAVSI